MTEEWRPVPPEYGKYWVSNLGRIKSEHRIMNPQPNKKGYVSVSVRERDGRMRTVKVHRLVCLAFGVITEDDIVNHIDGNKSNNRLENLERSNHQHNARHAKDTGLNPNRYGEKTAHKILKSEAEEIVRAYAEGVSLASIATRYGISTSAVSLVALGKSWPELDTLRKELGVKSRHSRAKKCPACKRILETEIKRQSETRTETILRLYKEGMGLTEIGLLLEIPKQTVSYTIRSRFESQDEVKL